MASLVAVSRFCEKYHTKYSILMYFESYWKEATFSMFMYFEYATFILFLIRVTIL